MHPMSTLFAYMAPQPSLPITSIVAVILGGALMLGRYSLALATRRNRTVTVRRTANQDNSGPHPDHAAACRT
jgi:hypothetical protein